MADRSESLPGKPFSRQYSRKAEHLLRTEISPIVPTMSAAAARRNRIWNRQVGIVLISCRHICISDVDTETSQQLREPERARSLPNWHERNRQWIRKTLFRQ